MEIQVAHPDYLLDAEKAGEIPAVELVYPATAGLPSRTFRKFAQEALERAAALPEWQDPAWLAESGFPAWREALVLLHSPAGARSTCRRCPSRRRRLGYDELLAHQLALAQRKASQRSASRPASSTPAPLSDAVEASPALHADRGPGPRRWPRCAADMASGERMGRLLQGDVGSGKTVVAMLAMADVAASGLQSALMAPTEILARQHYETLAPPLAGAGRGGDPADRPRQGLGRASEARPSWPTASAAVAVGTHALFQDDVAFHALGLTIDRRAAPLRRRRARSACRTRARARTWSPCRPRRSRVRWS